MQLCLTNILPYLIFCSDLLMKYLFRFKRVQRVQSLSATVQSMANNRDGGWKTYVPRLLYEHIVSDFIQPMQRHLENATNVNMESIRSNRGKEPYSLEEFHDIIAHEYDYVLTSANPSEKAIVYHTTPSNRNRNVGWYHVYEYHMLTVETIPDPVANEAHQEQRTATYRDYFWTGLCSLDLFSNDVSVRISVGHLLVGKLVLTMFPSGDGPLKSSLSVPERRQLYSAQISEDHTMSDLWPNFDQFVNFVKNCLQKTLKWKLHPFTPGEGRG